MWMTLVKINVVVIDFLHSIHDDLTAALVAEFSSASLGRMTWSHLKYKLFSLEMIFEAVVELDSSENQDKSNSVC